MDAFIRLIDNDEVEYKKLTALAEFLTAKSPRHYEYYVGNTYFDFGQNWLWTTVLCRTLFGSTYQAINAREQERAILATTEEDMLTLADDILNDSYCPDKLNN